MLFPQVRLVQDLISSGEIGTIVSAHAHALGGVPPWEDYRSDTAPFFAANTGPLVDVGVYPLHALTGLLGPVSSVAAFRGPHARASRSPVAPTPARWCQSRPMTFGSWSFRVGSAVASVEADFATVPSQAPECELRGESGAVAFSLLDVSKPVLIRRRHCDGWTLVDVPHQRAAGPDHILGVEHLIECVESGADPIPSAAHAIHVLEVIEAARHSAQGGETVRVTAPTGAFA
jgi:predicted dehydrogenase